jgi:NitT/TauT family transport system ATP-binding protein
MPDTPRPALPPGQRPKVLEMQGVDKTFNGAVMALRRMNLTVNEGDFISLLGPSGCGKSTALRLISGLMPPTAGRIQWAGAPGDLGMVFQEPTLMPWATVAQNVWLPFRPARRTPCRLPRADHRGADAGGGWSGSRTPTRASCRAA